MSTIHDDILAVKERLWHSMTEKQRTAWQHVAKDAYDDIVQAFDLLDAAAMQISLDCATIDSTRCWSCALLDCLAGDGPHPGPPPCGHRLQ